MPSRQKIVLGIVILKNNRHGHEGILNGESAVASGKKVTSAAEGT